MLPVLRLMLYVTRMATKAPFSSVWWRRDASESSSRGLINRPKVRMPSSESESVFWKQAEV